MTGAVLALVLALCPPPDGDAAPRAERETCALLAQDHATPVDRARLAAVFERPGFEQARKRGSGSFTAWLNQLKARLLALFETSGAATFSSWTRFFVLVGAGVVAVWGLAALRARRRRATEPASNEPVHGALVLDDPEVHLARARAMLATDAREALREAWLSLLSRLERQRLARPDRVKTNRELAAELPSRGASPALAEAVRAAAARFDQAFYSLEPVTSADAGRFLDEIVAASSAATREQAP